jgi:hypothetical protein
MVRCDELPGKGKYARKSAMPLRGWNLEGRVDGLSQEMLVLTSPATQCSPI